MSFRVWIVVDWRHFRCQFDFVCSNCSGPIASSCLSPQCYNVCTIKFCCYALCVIRGRDEYTHTCVSRTDTYMDMRIHVYARRSNQPGGHCTVGTSVNEAARVAHSNFDQLMPPRKKPKRTPFSPFSIVFRVSCEIFAVSQRNLFLSGIFWSGSRRRNITRRKKRNRRTRIKTRRRRRIVMWYDIMIYLWWSTYN